METENSATIMREAAERAKGRARVARLAAKARNDAWEKACWARMIEGCPPFDEEAFNKITFDSNGGCNGN